MIKREIANTLKQHLSYFPVVALTGPRQSGKSTVLQNVLEDYDYINLEDVNARKTAIEDPMGFIRACKPKTIIDEAQLAPQIFSAIQLRVDKNQINGEFVLSGSHNFLLIEKIKQSLAGRISLLTLLPLSQKEIYESYEDGKIINNPLIFEAENNTLKTFESINNIILQGSFPRIYNNKIPLNVFYRNYIKTYITKDVQDYLNVRNIATYSKLLDLLAHNVGENLSYQRYAKDLKTDARTIRGWINILVSSYVVYLLPTYSTNVRKQIVKAPKIYFCDTGLVCYLNKIRNVDTLIKHPNFGKIYENYIIVELLKSYLNQADDLSLHYYRDKSQLEIDLIDSSNQQTVAAEIKSTMTYQTKYKRTITKAQDLLSLNNVKKQIIYRGERSYNVEDIEIVAEKDWFNKMLSKNSLHYK